MINKTTVIASGAILAMALSTGIQAGWQDLFKSTVDELSKNGDITQAVSSLSETEMTNGLKQALANGVESAIATLGKQGGFMGNSAVQIPLPDSLKMVEKTTRSLGQGQYADQFITAMNRAAEEAVPESAALLGETIRQMSVEDAASIIKGPDDAATQYFRKVAGDQLKEKFHPIIQNATDQVGVTSAYKNLIDQAAPMLENPLLLRSLMPTDALDVDQYITNQALDGLFKYIALEEKKIRDNPAARTTDLLKKVFSGQ